jgi:putative FmdB family regulatory protein
MPIYEYRCTACDHLAEVIHGINDPGPRFCLSCGAEGTMRKGFGTPAVLFKGSGWARKERSSRGSSGGGSGASSEGSTSRSGGGPKESTSGGSASGDGASGSASGDRASGSSTAKD